MQVLELIGIIVQGAMHAFAWAFGDVSEPTWGDATDSQKGWTLGIINFVLLNDSVSAKQLHDQIFASLKASGWTHGDKTSREQLRHALCIAWEELPIHLRAREHVLIALIRSAAESVRQFPDMGGVPQLGVSMTLPEILAINGMELEPGGLFRLSDDGMTIVPFTVTEKPAKPLGLRDRLKGAKDAATDPILPVPPLQDADDKPAT
jgi:hypothetical protein